MKLLLLVASLVLLPLAAGAQTTDDFFDSRTLHEVRLYIHSADLRELRRAVVRLAEIAVQARR